MARTPRLVTAVSRDALLCSRTSVVQLHAAAGSSRRDSAVVCRHVALDHRLRLVATWGAISSQQRRAVVALDTLGVPQREAGGNAPPSAPDASARTGGRRTHSRLATHICHSHSRPLAIAEIRKQPHWTSRARTRSDCSERIPL